MPWPPFEKTTLFRIAKSPEGSEREIAPSLFLMKTLLSTEPPSVVCSRRIPPYIRWR